MLGRALTISLLSLLCARAAYAQLISIRTVPVSQAHQFEIFPSQTAAMGGVSIAVADSLLDPFVNPAKGVRLGSTRFFGSPATYSVSSNAGGGRTLPIGALTSAEPWFGGVWFALQEVDVSREAVPPPFLVCPACDVEGSQQAAAERSHGNTYALAMAGRELGASGLSIGGSVLWSRLNGIDGVDLLYAGSSHIVQSGHALDLRLGLLKEWAENHSLEAIVLHNRFNTTHDVHYLDVFWDPGTQQFAQRPRVEQYLDRTNTWGLHIGYEQPLSADGWYVGWMATVNRMDHPKIPNYAIMNIPRDPGHSSAFNIGIGVSRSVAASTFSIDAIYEPIWSHTWADAAEPVETDDGETIPAGGKTIENRFRFSNAMLRMGLNQRMSIGDSGPDAGLQIGLVVRNTHYWLDQHDHIQVSDRRHEERWWEWTPTWGFSLGFPTVEIRYTGSVTHGTGRPGVTAPPGFIEDSVLRSNILAAPSGPLTLDEVRVTTHQISLALPLH
jgi:hypothetical protein